MLFLFANQKKIKSAECCEGCVTSEKSSEILTGKRLRDVGTWCSVTRFDDGKRGVQSHVFRVPRVGL